MDRVPQPQAPSGLSIPRDTLIEIVGYIGAAVALTAAGIALNDASRTVQGLYAAAVAVVLLAAGWAIDANTDVLTRMKSVFWFLAVGSFAGAIGSLAVDRLGLSIRTLVIVVAGVTTVVAAVLWMLSKRSLQLIALFAAGVVALTAIVFPDLSVVSFILRPDFTGVAIAEIAWGLIWLGLGWKGLVQPRRTAMVLGSIWAIYGTIVPQQFGGSTSLVWQLAGIAISILLVAVGDLVGDRAPAGIGIVGTLLTTAALVSDRVEEQGPAVAVLIGGLVLLGCAIALVRSGAGTPRAVAGSPAPPMPPMDPPPA